MTFDDNKLTAARLWVISAGRSGTRLPDGPRNQPYLARALYALIPTPSDDVLRITVDEGWHLYVNPEWLAAASVPDVGRELVHLVWHLLNRHADRARGCGVEPMSAQRWRRAADEAIGEFTDSAGLRPRHIRLVRNDPPVTVEARFTMLTDERPPVESAPDDQSGKGSGLDECGSGADGIVRCHETPRTLDLPQVSRVDGELIRRDVATEFLRTRYGYGIGRSAVVERWAKEIVEPVVPWQQVLGAAVRRAVTVTAAGGDYTYRRPSRRTATVPNVVLPSRQRVIPEFAVVIDTSGSVDERMLGRALAEFDSIVSTLRISERGLLAVSADTVAFTPTRVSRAADIALLGGGGTDMTVGIAAVLEQRPRPQIVIVFTDGYTPWPNQPLAGAILVAVIIGSRRESLPATPDWIIRVECVDEMT
ncbi:MAG: hypothetical protein KC435_14550 [Thermomicrobiales bacterium]|nr:hypothetical protein [Thermomicrobiales bacterium]